MLEFEQLAVLDVDNGARFEASTIVGETGQVCPNGAAARLVHPGDTVIVVPAEPARCRCTLDSS